MASSIAPDLASNSRLRFQRCAATLRCEPVDRAPLYIPAIACDVSAAILGRTAYTGTGSVRYAEVAA